MSIDFTGLSNVTTKSLSLGVTKAKRSVSRFSIKKSQDDVQNVVTSEDILAVLSNIEIVSSEYSKERKKMQKIGYEILDALNVIRFNLLLGSMNIDELNKLLNDFSKIPPLNFPELQTMIEDIKLRLLVELAKFEVISE